MMKIKQLKNIAICVAHFLRFLFRFLFWRIGARAHTQMENAKEKCEADEMKLYVLKEKTLELVDSIW